MGERLRSWSIAALVACSSCATHLVGIVEAGEAGPSLSTMEGGHHRLLLDGGSRPLEGLDGHLVEIDGQRVLGRVRVGDWRILEGPHGLTTWVGPVVAYGVQIGIDDRNSGALYFVDEVAARLLQAHLGEIVVIEGYVDGPHKVAVLYWSVLARGAPPG